MHIIRLAKLALTVFALGFAFGGCGGRKVVTTKPVDIAIPPELARAFEVKELAPAAPKPVVEVEAPKKKKKERHRHHKDLTAKKGVETVPGIAPLEIPNRRPAVDPIWVGEKVYMDVTWLNTKAGEFELEVLPFKEIDGRKVYDFKGWARTSELFSLVYRADDWVESFVDYVGWFPYKFILHGDETKHIRNNLELFDHRGRKQYVATSDNRLQKGEVVEEKGIKDLTPLTQDSLSAIYFVRTFPFEVGKSIRFPMTTNGNQWDTEVSVLQREEVMTKMGYRNSFKCKIETRFKGELQQQGDAFMWFSDDERKYLLRFEAKVRIGWITGIAKRIDPGSPEPAAATPTTPPAAPSGASKSTSMNERGHHRVWFHQLMEAISGIKKAD